MATANAAGYEGAERAVVRALRLVGASLILLAAHIFYDSATALIARERPEESIPGIFLAALSLLVMPILAREKRKVAAALNSRALEADSFQTDVCMYLSAILLGGLALNATLGWWWADPLAALSMVPLIVREGREALRGALRRLWRVRHAGVCMQMTQALAGACVILCKTLMYVRATSRL